MSREMMTWALIAALTAVSYFTRAAFTLPGQRLRLPSSLERILRFAPSAALMAIIVPDLVRLNGAVILSPENPRLVAGVVAFVVAGVTRNIVATIAVGLLVLAWAQR